MAIKGYSGSVTVGINAVGDCKAWSLDISQETVDTTNFGGSGWKESVATLKSWSGSVTVIFDGTDAGQSDLVTGATSGSAVSLDLSDGTNTYSGDAIITSMPVTVDVNGIVEVSFSFEGSGALS